MRIAVAAALALANAGLVWAGAAFLPLLWIAPPAAVDYGADFGVRRIVIDPGHGGDNEGTRAIWGEREKTRNLRIARRLKERLEATGHWQVLMTRERDQDLPNSLRPEIANTSNADLYVSIHSNGNRRRARGFGVVWYAAQNLESSRRLGISVATALREAGFTPDMGMGPARREGAAEGGAEYKRTEPELPVYVRERADHRMIWPARMPAILLETHYMTDNVEALRFATDAAVDRLCAAIERGLAAFAAAPLRQSHPTVIGISE